MLTIEERIEKLSDFNKQKFKVLMDILQGMNLGEEKKQEGSLYFLLTLKQITLNDIKSSYPEPIYKTVSVLDKLDKLNYSQQKEEAENLRKMFFAITKDVRTIMLKIGLVVMQCRFAENLNDAERATLANSVTALYAPLSARLGLSNYKTELENSAFFIINPDKYNEIQEEVDSRFHKRQPIVERLVALVKKCMEELNITGRVYGRKKHIYSIYKKLESHPLDQIYDLIAVRAIVKNVADCYALIGRLHSEVEPIKNRFKDYIAIPKPNGYQSIHSTVKFEGFPVEIQIRTEDMHQYAEYGIAAHWMYKEKRSKQDSLDLRLAWLRQMMEDENASIDELTSSLNQDIYNNEIFVQTPKGKVIYLPTGSTPLDFAYSIHSEVGNKYVGAKVNGKMVRNTTALNNGDVVEIITNPNSKGPSPDWLKICKTSSARSKINTFFKKNIKEDTIRLGKAMLENAIKEKGLPVNRLMEKQNLQEFLTYYGMTDNDDLFANIGNNAISATYLANKLATDYQKQLKLEESNSTLTKSIALAQPSENQITVKGFDNTIVQFAGCCQPKFGDEIIGFISTGRGVIIHKNTCPNLKFFDTARLIEATWKPITQIKKPKKKNPKQKDSNKKVTKS